MDLQTAATIVPTTAGNLSSTKRRILMVVFGASVLAAGVFVVRARPTLRRWIRLHRHADPLIHRRSLDDTLRLLELR